MIPFHKPQIRLLDILLSPLVIHPREKLLFEFKNYFNTEDIILLDSARYGIKLALDSIGIDEDSEVIVPSLTCHSVYEAILESGGIPVLCDIEKNGFNMDPRFCEKLISEKTKAIIITHLFGIPAKIDKFIEIAKKYDLCLIEDCAQALGAEFNEKKVGLFGDFSVFSFGISKNITATGGGLLICEDKETFTEIKKRVERKRHQTLKKFIVAVGASVLFHKSIYGLVRSRATSFANANLNSSFDCFTGAPSNFDAKLILRQLKRYDIIMRKRNRNAEFCHSQLKINNNLFHLGNDCKPSYLCYPIVVKDKDEVQKHLLNNKIETKSFFDEIYNDFSKFIKIECSNLEKIIGKYVVLPLHNALPITKKMCNIIKES